MDLAQASLLRPVRKSSPCTLCYLLTQNAHHEDYQRRFSSGNSGSDSSSYPPFAHTVSLPHATCIDVPLARRRAAVPSDPGIKMAISPRAAPNLISMEIALSLSSSCACFQVPVRCKSDPAHQSDAEEKNKIKWNCFFFFTSFRDFSFRLLLPAHAAEGLPFILEILFLSLLCVVPYFLFLVPCRKRGSIQSIPFFYSAVPADTRLHALDWRRLREKKREKGVQSKERRTQTPRIYFPPFLSLLLLRSQQPKQAHEGRRQSGSDARVLHLLFLALCLPPPLLSASLCVPLCTSLLGSVCLRLAAPRRAGRDGSTRAETSVNVLMLGD